MLRAQLTPRGVRRDGPVAAGANGALATYDDADVILEVKRMAPRLLRGGAMGSGGGRRGRGPRRAAMVVAALAVLLSGCAGGSAGSAAHSTGVQRGGVTGKPGYLVYWDQNEEVDFLSQPSGAQGRLMPPWDLNGQVCVRPDRSGSFVGGLDPTLPSQHNPGGLKPYKQPAIGEELNLADGSFSGSVLYVPGRYRLPGQRVGDDSPPDSHGIFNTNSTYTGCAFDRRGDLFATDLGTAQGQYPPPDDGRLVEWFAPGYSTFCIVYGPTSGGVGPHHVDGTGGLSQPGMLATTPAGDLLVPVAGSDEVLRFDHSSLPPNAAACPGGLYPRPSARTSVFFKGSGSLLPFPAGVAADPSCGCYAISSFFGDPAIAWFTPDGRQEPGRTPVPGTPLTSLGRDPNAYNPFGMAFAPDGTLYFVDIHITCRSTLVDCGPGDYQGRVMKVTFEGGRPGTPTTVAGGFDFPTSVTVCVPSRQVCPYPSGRVVPPASGPSENATPAVGPSSRGPARAGFG